MLLSLFPMVSAASDEPLATILCGSDFQNNCYGGGSYNRYAFDATPIEEQERTQSLDAILASVRGAGIVPDATLFVGDYTDHFQEDGDGQYCAGDGIRQIESMFNAHFGDDYTATHSSTFSQGNHDYSGAYGLAQSGLQPYDESDPYIVYVINESQFPYGQSSDSSMLALVSATASTVSTELGALAQAGETRPVFIACHVPLHYSARSSGTDNTYAQVLFDSINTAAADLNIFYLYGHNHSGNPSYAAGTGRNDGRYEDAWGGAVNYVARGEYLDVNRFGHGSSANRQKLNFTYMNAGYVGYSNSSANNTLTVSLLSVYDNRVVLSRYDASGEYTRAESLGQSNPNSGGAQVNYPITVALRSKSAYAITVAANNTVYGKVSFDGYSATATPYENYAIEGWDLSPPGAATVTQAGNDFYFSDVTADCTFTVNFAEAHCVSAAFSDVDPALWYHDSIDYAISHKLFNGVSDTAFAPDQTMTRAMLATVLYRLKGSPVVYVTSVFSDVDKNAWYGAAICWAAVTQIVSGVGDGRFAPNDILTREQLATILYRYARKYSYATSAQGNLSGFSDSHAVSAYAQSAMQWAVGAGLLVGSDGMLDPQGGASRAQVATILMRFAQYVGAY
jgi:hypothetical protein